MLTYYLLYILSLVVTGVNTTYLYKKFQLTAGTGLAASILYMIVNGVISAILPAVVLLFSPESFETTIYSLIFAAATVIVAALSTILMFKAYEKGQIAIANICTTVGGIVLQCAWGVIFLKEDFSVKDLVAIVIMLIAVFLIMDRNGEKADKKLIWLYVLIVLCSCAVNMFSKQHQVETNFATVNTLSYSIWIGVIRTVLFAACIPYVLIKQGKNAFRFPKNAVGYAAGSSVFSGGCYIIQLFTAVVLPIVITSPLSTGVGILMSTLLPWFIYHEKMNKKQIAGVSLSLIGSVLFLITV